jgi:hypothetical protein
MVGLERKDLRALVITAPAGIPPIPFGQVARPSERRLNKPDSPINTVLGDLADSLPAAFCAPASRPGTSLLRPAGALRRADPAQRADRSHAAARPALSPRPYGASSPTPL